MSLPTAESGDEVRQLIESNLDKTREENNIQEVVAKAAIMEAKLSLVDDSGVFLEIPSFRWQGSWTMGCKELQQELEEANSKNVELRTELTVAHQVTKRQQAEVTCLTE